MQENMGEMQKNYSQKQEHWKGERVLERRKHFRL